MIRLMIKSSVPLLLAGFFAGFLVMYLAVRDRDMGPLVIRDPSLLQPSPPASQEQRDLIAQLESRLTGTPADLPALTDLANLNWDIEDFAQAAVWYRRALEIDPNNPDLHTDLGTALFYENQVDESLAEFQQALEINPDHAQALINMGIVLIEARNDRDGAIALWQHFLETSPDHPRAGMIREEIANLRTGGV
jgi:cytochrome c-type biogenesis protein CcmH/NrfG